MGDAAAIGDVAALVAGLVGKTSRDALSLGQRLLTGRAPDEPTGDARRLLVHALQTDVIGQIKRPDRLLSHLEAERFAEGLRRRSAGEPVSRIIGWRGFYGREFAITPATLDPRPETETLVDVVLEMAAVRWPGGRGLELIDIGTGSGCLMVTLLAEMPEARGVGVDISADALAMAARNADRLGVADRCRWIEGRNFGSATGQFPLIVSNPPYIATGDIPGLALDVRQYDPVSALDGGADGLDIYREIAGAARTQALKGWIVLEAGDGQADDIATIFRDVLRERAGNIAFRADLAGKQRCVAVEVLN